MNDSDAEGYYEVVAPEVSSEGWDRVAAAPLLGWSWKTPIGRVPMGLMEPNEVLDFLEGMEKGGEV